MIILMGVFFFQYSCTEDNSPNGNVNIRIKNTSEFDYSNVIVNSDGTEKNYGSIFSNQYSEYKTFDYAYRYAFIELEIQGETLTLMPTDYVGETKLTSGNYTYLIGANENTLSITFQTD